MPDGHGRTEREALPQATTAAVSLLQGRSRAGRPCRWRPPVAAV